MRVYKAPPDIESLFVGGQFYAVRNGLLEVQDGIDIDQFLRPLGFVDAPAESHIEIEVMSGTDSPA